MGTPLFAVPALEALIANKINVVAVVTAPDKPAGRGHKLQASPVKMAALAHHLPVLQPIKLRDPQFLTELAAFNADLQVVVAFRMLPQAVFAMPKYGSINLHASLLPQYRGAAPINWAIINGETETGLTTFFIEQEIDTGSLIFQAKLPIFPDENAGHLHDRMMQLGADLLVKTVQAIISGKYPNEPQHPQGQIKLAPKIFTDTCRINFNQPAQAVYNFIRGLSPYPGAFTHLNGEVCKIFAASLSERNFNAPPGTIYINDAKTSLQVATALGWLNLHEIQMTGKARISPEAFLRGYRQPLTHFDV